MTAPSTETLALPRSGPKAETIATDLPLTDRFTPAVAAPANLSVPPDAPGSLAIFHVPLYVDPAADSWTSAARTVAPAAQALELPAASKARTRNWFTDPAETGTV